MVNHNVRVVCGKCTDERVQRVLYRAVSVRGVRRFVWTPNAGSFPTDYRLHALAFKAATPAIYMRPVICMHEMIRRALAKPGRFSQQQL